MNSSNNLTIEPSKKRIRIDVFQDGKQLVCEYDGVEYRGDNCFQLDSRLIDAGVPMPHDLYYIESEQL